MTATNNIITTAPAAAFQPLPPLVAGPPGPLTFGTLLRVELRKLVDTRSGRLLLATILGLAVFILGWKLTKPDLEVSVRSYGGPVAEVVAFLVPVLGLLAMTSEWTHRTALTTFTLAPRRGRVLAAKYTAAMVGSMAVMAGAFVGVLAAVGLGGMLHGDASFAGIGGLLRSAAILIAMQVTMGAAFGALAGLTPIALGCYFIAPTAWGAAGDSLLGDAAPWFDVFATFGRLTADDPFRDLGYTVTSVSVWVVIPFVVGIARAIRREAK